jgi:hypothetical protein
LCHNRLCSMSDGNVGCRRQPSRDGVSSARYNKIHDTHIEIQTPNRNMGRYFKLYLRIFHHFYILCRFSLRATFLRIASSETCANNIYCEVSFLSMPYLVARMRFTICSQYRSLSRSFVKSCHHRTVFAHLCIFFLSGYVPCQGYPVIREKLYSGY